MLTIKQATLDDFDNVIQFYCDLIYDMQDAEFKTAWKMGVYPTEQLLRDAIINQSLFIAGIGDILVGAMILNNDCANEYNNAKWGVEATKEEVKVVHLLAVSLAYQRKGIAKQMLSKAVELCKKDSIKAIRLDILHYNSPAENLYKSLGFQHVGTMKLFYEDTGLTDFNLYELVL